MNASNMVLVVHRQLKASPERLFEAWTQPKLMTQWFHASQNMDTTEVVTDLRVGGEWKIVMHHTDTHEYLTSHGKYLVLDRPNQLAFTWFPCKKDYETKVTLHFKKISDDVTELILTHEGLRDEEDFQGHNAGWKAILETFTNWLVK